MHFARRPAHDRALLVALVALAIAVGLATMLGLVHRTLHGAATSTLRAAHAMQAVPVVALAQPADRATEAHDELSSFFGAHTDAECRLYDQLSHGSAALCVPLLILPVVLPAATFAYLEGQALARWVALFDARGPPPTR